MKEKIKDYTNDINKLLERNSKKLSRKLAHFLALMLHQTEFVRHQMLSEAIRTHFNFLFLNSKKNHSDEFKKTVLSVLINALAEHYHIQQAKKHVFGYVLSISSQNEMEALYWNEAKHPNSDTMPPKENMPKIAAFIESTLELQKKFEAIPEFKVINERLLAVHLVSASFYEDEGRRYFFITPTVVVLFLMVLLESYLAITHFLSPDKNDNAKVLPIILTSLLIDIIGLKMLFKAVDSLLNQNKKLDALAMQAASQSVLNNLPKVIKVKIKVNEKIHYTYSLPIFKDTAPVKPVATEAAPNSKKLTTRVKTRPSYSTGLFKSPDSKPSLNQQEIIRDVDGVHYRQLRNINDKPMDIFVGYTQEDLDKFTTAENRDTFKTLLDSPHMVAPKDKQGFVYMKHQSNKNLANVKLKYHGDLRLFFSLAPNKDEKIKFYRLSGAKTHNQSSR